MTEPLLFEIKGNSLDDGPGIRTVVFFKGCPLDCAWCHNPESKRREAELSFDAVKCIGCGHCINACPESAVSKKKKSADDRINRKRCTRCFACVDGCPSGAISKVGFSMPIPQLVAAIVRDKPFFDNSGGGVTLSGGEPTLAMDYATSLAKELRKKSIPVLLETCGLFSYDRFRDTLFPHLDSVFFDIKIIDAKDHNRYCGADNRVILENFTRLASDARTAGIDLLPRTPLVPGLTDTKANLSAVADFLKSVGVSRAALLAYNPLWHDKSASVGGTNQLGRDKKMRAFMTPEHASNCREIFTKKGIDVA